MILAVEIKSSSFGTELVFLIQKYDCKFGTYFTQLPQFN